MKNISWMILAAVLSLSQATFAGAVSGGGGNIMLDEQLPADLISKTLEATRRVLLAYFNGAEIGNRPELQGLLKSSPSIRDVILSTHIEVKEDGPCYDSTGASVDGSSEGSTPNTICISLESLRSKLHRGNLYHQTLALAAHEFSHRLGYDETQAKDLQNFISSDLRRLYGDTAVEGEKRFWQTANSIRKILDYQDGLLTAIEHLKKFLAASSDNDSYISQKAWEHIFFSGMGTGSTEVSLIPGVGYHDEYTAITRFAPGGNWVTEFILSYLTKEQYSRYLASILAHQSIQIDYGSYLFLPWANEPYRKSKYLNAFFEKNSIPAVDFFKLGPDSLYLNLVPKTVMIKKMETVKDFREVVSEYIRSLEELVPIIKDLRDMSF